MFQDGTLSLGMGNLVYGLKANQTTYRSLTLGDRISNDGNCKGPQYFDPYGTRDDIVVQGSIHADPLIKRMKSKPAKHRLQFQLHLKI